MSWRATNQDGITSLRGGGLLQKRRSAEDADQPLSGTCHEQTHTTWEPPEQPLRNTGLQQFEFVIWQKAEDLLQ